MLTLKKDLMNPASHLAVIETCTRQWQGRDLVLASPPGSRYPYVYPRDLAGCTRVLLECVKHDFHADVAYAYMESAAEFLLSVQRPDGHWGQRYDLHGADKSIYRQEDNVAHGLIVLGSYLAASRHLKREPPRLADVLDSAETAYRHALKHVYRPGINLFYSTTSVHESGIESGYTLWTNLAFHRAISLLVEALEAHDTETDVLEDAKRFHAMHSGNVRRHFVQDGLFLRRITSRGRYDRRPDVTLLAPYYFDCVDLDPEALRRSADKVAKDLWDPDMGLLQRYLPFAEDLTIHLHAGNGPWLAYSAIYAQYHAAHGDRRKAEETLDAIQRYATAEGNLPEHLSTRERFEDFMAREWETGIDFEKEFTDDILLPGVSFSTICEELIHMRNEYQRISLVLRETEDEIIRFATPLMWSHAEFLHALLQLKDGKKD
jgi:GH15 family glucan-1,4-alpha-glucosidase